MTLTLTPPATYAARVLTLTLACVLLCGRIDLLALAIPLGLVLGGLFYRADFRARAETGETATLRPLRALTAWPFWQRVALTTLVYTLYRAVLLTQHTTWIPSPIGWIGAMILFGIAGEGLRAIGLRHVRRLPRF